MTLVPRGGFNAASFRHDDLRVLPAALALPPVQSEPGGYVRRPGEDRYYGQKRHRLIAARRQAGLTQFQLAVATGLTVTAVSNLEVGRTRYPRLVTMERIAAALGVSLKWLCDE